ncbi:hypothetical protein BC628DRAFT_505280 [Trametes gibbosa]|nr:hypothetical protein BC628DRAFT_505280 [Trametes gibbosa]
MARGRLTVIIPGTLRAFLMRECAQSPCPGCHWPARYAAAGGCERAGVRNAPRTNTTASPFVSSTSVRRACFSSACSLRHLHLRCGEQHASWRTRTASQPPCKPWRVRTDRPPLVPCLDNITIANNINTSVIVQRMYLPAYLHCYKLRKVHATVRWG